MEKEMPKIQVQDVQTGQVLFECALKDVEKAYVYAAEMEEMGLDVKVVDPTLAETLTSALGLSASEKQEYRDSMEQEIEEHEGSCCFEESSEKKNLQ
jgi:hypothetical protein